MRGNLPDFSAMRETAPSSSIEEGEGGRFGGCCTGIRKRLEVKGIVQGVGFRPFVYRLAVKAGLCGFVKNTSQGVVIEVEGEPDKIGMFEKSLVSDHPSAVVIDGIQAKELEPAGYRKFEISGSQQLQHRLAQIPPDIATCRDCLSELFNEADRRYRYPFINCTNCGPRYTIIKDIPYDRPMTTMSCFEMCPGCEVEYNDPMNRRFHAQPNGCGSCGPSLSLHGAGGKVVDVPDPINKVVEILQHGGVIAIKGIGGFHIACDACSEEAVQRIRNIKRRGDKPLAVMVPDLQWAEKICCLTDFEKQVLRSYEAPIVLLKGRRNSVVARSVAPGVGTVGVMLPYTPVHHLIMKQVNRPLVMTSANVSDNPIMSGDEEIFADELVKVDFILTHNRDIHVPVDDSVVMCLRETMLVLRRARGFVPVPVKVAGAGADRCSIVKESCGKVVAGLGGMLKSSFTFLRDGDGFVSQYFGDLSVYQNYRYYRRVFQHWIRLYGFSVDAVVCDMHPDYPSTWFANQLEKDRGVKAYSYQHHKAHIVSVIAECGIDEPVLGVAFDGTGYGEDGKLWGGEFFTGTTTDLRRVGHISYFPLPGGEQAIKQPWRIKAAMLYRMYGEEVFDLPYLKEHLEDLRPIVEMIKGGIVCPYTSSCGRFFDGLSSLLGIRDYITYEAQAAIELEAICDSSVREYYRWQPCGDVGSFVLYPEEVYHHVIQDIETGVERSIIGAKIHNTVAQAVLDIAQRIREETGIKVVVMSGGVFQNKFLLSRLVSLLEGGGFKCYFNRIVPINDGGISLGQAYWGFKKIVMEDACV